MSDENDWLGDLPGIREIFRDGVAFIRRKALDFKGTGWTLADNPSTGRTDISIDLPVLAGALAEDPSVIAALGELDLAAVATNGNDAGGREFKNLGAPTTPSSAARIQDMGSYILVIGSGEADITINAATYGARDPATTPVLVALRWTGTKKITLANDSSRVIGQTITITKTWISSGFTISAPGSQIEQSTADFVVPVVAASRTVTLCRVSDANGYSFVGAPLIDGYSPPSFNNVVVSGSLTAPTPTLAAHAATKAYVDALAAPRIAQYTIGGSGLSLNDVCTLTEERNAGGFALVGGNGVQVPEAGWYEVQGKGLVRSSSTADVAPGSLLVRAGTPGSSGSSVCSLDGRRFSDDPLEEFAVVGFGAVQITNPATQLIWLQNVIAASIDVPLGGTLLIRRVG